MIRVRVDDDSLLPVRGSAGAAGYDLRAGDERTLNAGERAAVATGVTLEIPTGWVGLIRDRSGMASKGLLVMAGVVDSDYRGEVKVLVWNTGDTPMALARGQRIAQILFVPCYMGELEVVSDLTDTVRGAGGFGSTGTA